MIACRRAAVVLAVVLPAALLSHPGTAVSQKVLPKFRPAPAAPPQPAAPAQKGNEPANPLTDKRLVEQLEAAADYIKDQDWETATRVLDKLLRRKDDVLVPAGRAAGGKGPQVWVSARTEAQRRIAGLPKEGMEFYRIKYGPDADERLKLAKQNNDPDKLAEVVRVYLYTDAGPEALRALAGHHSAAGHFRLAALAYRELLRHRGIARWTPEELYRATAAFRRAGDREADRTLRELLDRVGSGGLRLGKEALDRGQIEKRLGGVGREPRGSGWPLYRADPARSDEGPGTAPFLRPRWKLKTVRGKGTENWLKRAGEMLRARNLPILPASFPVGVTVRAGKKTVPLVLYRSHGGIHAVDAARGKLEWGVPSVWSIDWMFGDPDDVQRSDSRKAQAITQWMQQYLGMQRPEMIFHNSSVGTLSADDRCLYAVEDFAVPPPPPQPFNAWGQPNPNAYGQDLNDAIEHNRLQVYHLATGKLLVELGEKGGKGELSDSFFLGPPLPLEGRAYVLNQKKDQLRLVCLEVVDRTVKVRAVQPLATVGTSPAEDPLRRMQAASLAYADGILVCPTNAGVVFGIDVLSHNTVWACTYPQEAAAPPAGPGNPWGQFLPRPEGWRVTAPAVQDGKVVFAAPDARSVHCVRLKDGSRIWSRPRGEDDLYLAGVFNGRVLIVGKKFCRALSLDRGETLWTLPVGLPSGQGVASDGVYYLPLRESARNRQPEVCAIDLNRGIIRAHIRSRNEKDVPGNLMFFGDLMVSQTPTELVAYPLLKARIERMDARLARNPNDPEGLTDRAELRLDKGDVAGAVEDLRKALANKPGAPTRDRAREELYEALTEYLQRDFAKAEKYLPEYEDLCKVEGARNEQERERRLTNYYALLGRVREKQGRPLDALKVYLDLAARGKSDDMLHLADEPAVKVRRDVWVRGRIADLLKRATPEQRKKLEEEIARRWKDAQGRKDVRGLRTLAAAFGPGTAPGRKARMDLAERLRKRMAPGDLLEAELLLEQVWRQGGDRQEAARAVLALARLQTARGLLADAAHYYRVLGRDFPKVVVEDGKTGADLLQAAGTDKRLLPYVGEPRGFSLAGPISVRMEDGKPFRYQSYTFGHAGEDLPFFRKNQIVLRYDTGNLHRIKMVDADTGKVQWESDVGRTLMQFLVYTGDGRDNHRIHHRYQNVGHLVILPVGNMVFGIDPLGKGDRKVLWEKDLLGLGKAVPGPFPPGLPQQSQPILTVDPRDGSILATYPRGWKQRLGRLFLTPSLLVVQTRAGLEGVDPLTGQTLWIRSDVSEASEAFGDDEAVYVAELKDGEARATRALRAGDGGSVRVPDFTAAYNKRLRVLGHTILLADSDDKNVTLRLYDVPAGKDLWRQAYPAKSVVLRSEDRGLAGVIERGGRVHVVDLATRKELPAARVEPKYLDKANAVRLLADRWNFYVAVEESPDLKVDVLGVVQTNLMPGSGLHAAPVNGEVYAFSRDTGKTRWHVPVPKQMIVLNYFREVPIVLCTSRYIKRSPGRGAEWYVAVKAIAKRTGKLVIEREDEANQMQYHALRVHPAKGVIEFLSGNQAIVFEDRPAAPGK